MSAPDNILDLLQDDVIGRMAGDPFFDTLLIIHEEKGVTDSEVEEALGGDRETSGKLSGLVIIVYLPDLEPKPAQSGPQYYIRIVVRIIELPRLNRAAGGTGKRAQTVQQKIDQLFHQWVIGNRCVAVEKAERYNDGEGGVGFDTTLLWQAGQSRPVQARAPFINNAELLVTLTNNESGADLYYSTDFSLPRSGAGTLYTVPFAVANGTMVRACAYISGKQASDVPEKRITGNESAKLREDGGVAIREDGGTTVREGGDSSGTTILRENDGTALREDGETALRENE